MDQRKSQAEAIRAAFEEERGFSTSWNANSHVCAYWRHQLEVSGGDPSDPMCPYMGDLIHAALIAGNLPSDPELRRGFRR